MFKEIVYRLYGPTEEEIAVVESLDHEWRKLHLVPQETLSQFRVRDTEKLMEETS